MKELSEIPFIQADKAWYFLSVFYARENWTELVSQINQFYQNRRDKFCACLISFSEDKGEHVEISLVSTLEQGNLKDEIDRFFLSFVKEFSSMRKTIFPYGKAVWCDYQNNTLLWNRFRRMEFIDYYVNFHQASFQLALSLIENDTSPDMFFSVCLYLITIGLTCIEPEKQKSALSKALHDTSTDFKNYGHIDSVKILIDERIDLQEIGLTLDSYWDEKESEFSSELKVWLENTKILMDYYSYSRFCSFICTMFGLKGLSQLMILELMNNWHNTKQKANA